MLDILDPPKSVPINPPQEQSTLQTSNIDERTLCYHDSKFFVMSDDLYYFSKPASSGSTVANAAQLQQMQQMQQMQQNQSNMPQFQQNSFQWTKVTPIPFGRRQGQSITSTPSGLVFFGGQEGPAAFYNDLWIYSATEWFYVTTSVPARSHHAAAYDKVNCHLVIYGGFGLNQVKYSDLYIIDIQTQETIEIKINNLPFFTNHTLTQLDDGTFFLCGSKITQNPNNVFTKVPSINIIDLNTKSGEEKITEIPIEFNNHTIFESRNYAALIYGMIFIFGQSPNVWMFHLEQKLWIKLALPEIDGKTINPEYVFISNTFSDKTSLHIVDGSLTKLHQIPVFTKSPPSNVNESPEFLHFLKNNINESIKFFQFTGFRKHTQTVIQDNFSVRKAVLPKIRGAFQQSDVIQKFFDLEDRFNQCDELRRKAERINKLMMIIDRQSPSMNNSTSCDNLKALHTREAAEIPHDAINNISKFRHETKLEIEKLDQIVDYLSREIEKFTFLATVKRELSTTPPISPNQQQQLISLQLSFNSLSQKSQQLANEIQFEQDRLNEELKKRDSAKFTKKSKILNIVDQLCGLTNREVETNDQLKATQAQFFNNIMQIFNFRSNELSIVDRNMREVALKLLRIPTDIEAMKGSQEDLRRIKEMFAKSVDDINSNKQERCEGSAEMKINKITNQLQKLQDWKTDAERWTNPNSVLNNSNKRGFPLPNSNSNDGTTNNNLNNNINQQQQQQQQSNANNSDNNGNGANQQQNAMKRKKIVNIGKGKRGTIQKANMYFTRFNECVGNEDTFYYDLGKVLNEIEDTLNALC